MMITVSINYRLPVVFVWVLAAVNLSKQIAIRIDKLINTITEMNLKLF
jgi:hypothetical protein